MNKKKYDIIIIGGGIIGCAIAYSLSKKLRVSIAVIEKENEIAKHASGRNSGVIHTGFYYTPGSLKARFCVEGNKRLINYCIEENIPYKKTGTLVVGKSQEDKKNLEILLKRGKKNNVPGIRIINKKELNEMEPFVNGKFALYSPMGAIVDAKKLVNSLASNVQNNGVEFIMNQRVKKIKNIKDEIEISTTNNKFSTKFVINCAGVYADTIARLMNIKLNHHIIPFRGEYFELPKNKSHLVRSMVYPIPNPNLPFLGIHLTRTVNNKIILGPNAVLAPGKEAYSNKNINVRELSNILLYKGFWKMVYNNYNIIEEEILQSIIRTKFLEKVCDLLPGIKINELIKNSSGIRAQLVGNNGELMDDLVVKEGKNALHILNAVSPGMTCSLPFADYLVENYVKKYNFEKEKN
ncbi:MAG: L-2-hydroxyglutarate oxidase [Thaumarchaeota archaeon]|nr:L-2-hydroxyglutarate oxidase [Nitrososphaerota archaeon]|tara:strand:+ start:8164 stop:9387 length:1224 start_codon:yes stop_codon:yes gene_type:complete